MHHDRPEEKVIEEGVKAIKSLNSSEGLALERIDTPALVLDAALLEGNIRKMAEFASEQGISLRPHAKTHKCPIIAHKQVEAGAIGVTCAKVSEAEIMGYAGIKEILIANQLVTREKIERLVSLGRHCRVMVAVESLMNAEAISQIATSHGEKISVIIECNIGMDRCGTNSPEETLRLAAGISKLPGLTLKGLMGYEGHTVFLMPREERLTHSSRAIEALIDHKAAMHRGGFSTEVVSAAGTGTYDMTGRNKEITDIQVGSYATMDMRYKSVGIDFDLALSVLCTVISRPDKNTAIIDVGMKGVTKEFGLPVVKGVDGATVFSLSEEHGKLQLSGESLDLKVGDKLELLPSHGCTTINLYDNYHVHRYGLLEAIWPVAARGALT